jgi:hypothetical protein
MNEFDEFDRVRDEGDARDTLTSTNDFSLFRTLMQTAVEWLQDA